MIPENEIGRVVWDHEKRINDLEKVVPNLVDRVDGVVKNIEELKTIVIEGHKESMETLKGVIAHEQNMEKMRQEFKQELQRMELDFKKRQFEMEEKHREEKEKFEREQEAENKKMIRELFTKLIMWGTPIITAIVTGIVKIIETFFK